MKSLSIFLLIFPLVNILGYNQLDSNYEKKILNNILVGNWKFDTLINGSEQDVGNIKYTEYINFHVGLKYYPVSNEFEHIINQYDSYFIMDKVCVIFNNLSKETIYQKSYRFQLGIGIDTLDNLHGFIVIDTNSLIGSINKSIFLIGKIDSNKIILEGSNLNGYAFLQIYLNKFDPFNFTVTPNLTDIIFVLSLFSKDSYDRDYIFNFKRKYIRVN